MVSQPYHVLIEVPAIDCSLSQKLRIRSNNRNIQRQGIPAADRLFMQTGFGSPRRAYVYSLHSDNIRRPLHPKDQTHTGTSQIVRAWLHTYTLRIYGIPLTQNVNFSPIPRLSRPLTDSSTEPLPFPSPPSPFLSPPLPFP